MSASRYPEMDAPIGVYPIVASLEQLAQMLEAKVSICQLRIKTGNRDVLSEQVAEAVAMTKETACRLFVNDYWDLAIEFGAYGVHLGQEDLDTADLDAIAAAGLRLGVSTHDDEEASRAKALQPSYIALGPIFPTTCKAMRFGPQGIAKIPEWRRKYGEPLVAIGGLRLEHVAEVKRAGAEGIAVISDIFSDPDPITRARAWCMTWEEY